MKKINSNKIAPPGKIVVLGSNGFVGNTIINSINNNALSIECVGINRSKINFLQDNADDLLLQILNPEDVLVIAIAKAPCKTPAMLAVNIEMLLPICRVLEKINLHQVIYVSSDAVYSDSDKPLTEKSSTAPESLHGIMHLSREIMLKSVIKEDVPLCIARPTLIYGENDPHNSYGPNMFRRLAQEGKDITLFGKGEELRDHVHVETVAKIIEVAILYRVSGVINCVSGKVVSFHDLAEQAIQQWGNGKNKIIYKARNGSMPHNGYREFKLNRFIDI